MLFYSGFELINSSLALCTNVNTALAVIFICYTYIMKKLIFFGDSLLARINPDMIKKIEESIGSIIIDNHAVGGSTTNDALEIIESVSKLKADYVVISLGTNDILKDNLSCPEYLENMIKIISEFSESKVFVWLTPPANDINDPEGTKEFNEKIGQYFDGLKNICKDYNFNFIDTFSVYKDAVMLDNKYHEEDGIHLSVDGYKLFTGSLVKTFK